MTDAESCDDSNRDNGPNLAQAFPLTLAVVHGSASGPSEI